MPSVRVQINIVYFDIFRPYRFENRKCDRSLIASFKKAKFQIEIEIKENVFCDLFAYKEQT